MIVSVENAGKVFADKTIFKNVSFRIENDSRIGLIGVNGAGKTTLLNLITGRLTPDEGSVYVNPNMRVGFLEQRGIELSGTIIDRMKSAFSGLISAEKRMKEIEAGLNIPENANEYAQLQAYFETSGGYQIDYKIKTVLNGMGFSGRAYDTPISVLSGGEKTRLALAGLLLEEPDLLILDEPTNHLDFKALNWLETYLKSYKGAILTVSHDRYFLDGIVDCIYELEHSEIVRYNGNYTKYKTLKAERFERLMKEYEAQQEEIASLEDYVRRNIARASTASSARGRQKTLDRMEKLERPRGGNKTVKLHFDVAREPFKEILTVDSLDISINADGEEKILSSGISMEVLRGEKIAIIGENGVGKSTFLKIIQNILPCKKGRIRWGGNVKRSYYEQENANLSQNSTAIDEIWNRYRGKTELEIRNALGAVRLTGDNVYKKVSVLSGGERARLSFAILMLEKSNVLILDEPTNHLDLDSKELLENALAGYSGTLIFVSHDRYLLNRVPTKIIEFTKNGIKEYKGNYDYYKSETEQSGLKAFEEPEITNVPKKISVVTQPKQPQSNYRSKESRVQDAKRRTRLKELEILIDKTEQELIILNKRLNDEDVYSDYVLSNQINEEIILKTKLLDDSLEEWTALESQ